MKFLWMAVLLVSFVGVTGCVYDAAYCRYSGDSGTGYDEKHFDDGSWGVEFVGGYPDFCKEAAYYHAAELTWEKGYRYFKVLQKADVSRNVETSGPHTTASGGQVAGSSVYVPMYLYKIRMVKTSGAGTVDAYHVLNTHKYPRKEEPYTVDERNGDKSPSGK